MRLLPCRTLVLFALAFPLLAQAQAISGTLEARFEAFDTHGVPTVSMTLALSCGLSCEPAAPDLHYTVAGLIDAHFAAEPATQVGYVSTAFAAAVDPSGAATGENTSFPAGSNIFLLAHSVSCRCGNRLGEGGYVELRSQNVSVPPGLTVPSSAQAGKALFVSVAAAPRGNETVEVHLTGAGVEVTKTFAAADYAHSGTSLVRVTPTQVGKLSVTARVGGGTAATKSFEVAGPPGAPGTGGGGGGGLGPKKEEHGSGCSAARGSFPFAGALLVSLLRRRVGARALSKRL